ncbi:MAG: Mur ligase family protein [Anaerovoracaceae bacterium]
MNIGLLGSVRESETASVVGSCSTVLSPFDVSFARVYSADGEERIGAFDEYGSYCTKDGKSYIIDLGDNKIGVAFFNAGKRHLARRVGILTELKTLKKSGANFTVAYVRGKKKVIARWGFDCVVGIGDRVGKRAACSTLSFRPARIINAAGCLSKEPDGDLESPLPGIAYGLKVGCRHKKHEIIQEGYLPLIIYHDGDSLSDIRIMDNASLQEEEKELYRRIQKKMFGVAQWGNIITLSDVFAVLGETIPDKYKYLSDYSVNQICARTYEAAPGNIFFFRRQFTDKNDKNIEPEWLRNRLVMRAFIKKSLFVFSYKKLPSYVPHIKIADPTEAHIKLMAWYRSTRLHDAKIIAVTGSTGKTSTKDMICSVLREGFLTYASVRNTNVQVKIGINLQSLPKDCQVYVQETGGGRPGGASRHSRMVKPDISVITNIGTAHIGNYNSQQELMQNKLGIIDGMDHDGTLYLNGDDKLLVTAKPQCNVVYFALNNKNADYYAENIVEKDNRTFFDIVHEGKPTSVVINVLGKYNILNALCAFAIAKQWGMDDDAIKRGLENYKTEGIRQNVLTVEGITLFVDCYNASAESVETSMSVLDKLEGKRKIAIIGDITGVGDLQEEINKRVAATLDAHQADYVVCYGAQSENIVQYMNHCDGRNVIFIKDKHEMETWLSRNAEKEDVILFKGSSKMKLDDLIDDVFGLNLSDQRYIDESHYMGMQKDNAKYKVFPEHVSLSKYYGDARVVRIKSKLMGRNIKKVWDKAFAGNEDIEIVRIGDNVQHIGDNCFENCMSLKKVVIPEKTKGLGSMAFSDCHQLEEVEIRGKLAFLGEDVFAGCGKLRSIKVSAAMDSEMVARIAETGIEIVL